MTYPITIHSQSYYSPYGEILLPTLLYICWKQYGGNPDYDCDSPRIFREVTWGGLMFIFHISEFLITWIREAPISADIKPI